MRRIPCFLAILALSLGACNDALLEAPIAPSLLPAMRISDGAHGGNAHFFFLPPLVQTPATTGTADGTLAPVVTVCDLGTAPPSANTPCDPSAQPTIVARFSITEGTGAQTVRYDQNSEQYIVNWPTDQSLGGGLKIEHYYRIRVHIAGILLGHVDVTPVRNGSEVRNQTTGEVVPLLSGRTLPIKFRIESGAVPPIIGDAAADFSAEHNPNGLWSSGWTASLGSALHLYPSATPDGQFVRWLDAAINSLETPNFAKNIATDGSVIFGSLPDQVSLHPGCHAAEFSVLRWTAPAAGMYTVHAQFFAGDGSAGNYGETTAHILKNSGASTPLFHAPATSTNPSFSQSITLGSGEYLDFVVGTGADGCFFDTTPLAVTITSAP